MFDEDGSVHPDDDVEECSDDFFVLAELMNIARQWDGLPVMHPADAVSHLQRLFDEYAEHIADGS